MSKQDNLLTEIAKITLDNRFSRITAKEAISRTLAKIREVVEDAGLTGEVHFYLHADTPYKLQSKEMDAFLKGVGGGSRAMKQAILNALKEKK